MNQDLSNSPARAKPIEEILLLPALNYTKKDSILSSKIELEAESKGMPTRRTDAMIAANTINNGATLYTFDSKHFSPLKSLRLKLFP
jgi:predicted nucleic acid-binding protein